MGAMRVYTYDSIRKGSEVDGILTCGALRSQKALRIPGNGDESMTGFVGIPRISGVCIYIYVYTCIYIYVLDSEPYPGDKGEHVSEPCSNQHRHVCFLCHWSTCSLQCSIVLAVVA